MKTFLCAIFVVSLGVPATPQQSGSMPAAAKPATLVSGIGEQHHPVATKNAEAQQFFDQGLRYIYAFNHEEAARSFERAAELDPELAMAYWGLAEAIGPNYNDPASNQRFQQAHAAIAQALRLSAHASPSKREYIPAMPLRFPPDPRPALKQAAAAYPDPMRQL